MTMDLLRAVAAASLLPLTPLLMAACATSGSGAGTDDPDARDPEDGPASIARAFLEALADSRWRDAASLVDHAFIQAEFHAWRSMEEPPPYEVSAEAMMRQDPDMPREVAEWEAEWYRRVGDHIGSPLSREFAGVDSLAELRRMEPLEAMARRLEALVVELTGRMQVPAGRSLDELDGGPVVPGQPGVLGSAAIDRRHAVVLYGPVYDRGRHQHRPAMLLLRQDREWRVLPVFHREVFLTPELVGQDALDTLLDFDDPAPDDGWGPAATLVASAARSLEARDWAAAASLLDPDLLSEWHARQVEDRRRMERPPPPPPTAEELMSRDPDLPDAVARYRAVQLERAWAAQAERRGGPAPWDRTSAREMATLDPLDAFAAHLHASDFDERTLRYLEAEHPEIVDGHTANDARTPRRRHRVIGEVPDGERVLVIYGVAPASLMLGPGPAFMEVFVETVPRSEQGWRLTPDAALFRYGQGRFFYVEPAPE